MNKETNISIDTIKRHSKRLQKTLIENGLAPNNFKLTAAQEILSKTLGCNNWFELNENLKKDIVKPEATFFPLPFLNHEQSQNILNLISNEQRYNRVMEILNALEIKDNRPTIMVIDNSNTIRKAIELFVELPRSKERGFL